MADDARKKELDVLLQRRDQLRDKVQRVSGRLDSARQTLKEVEDECLRRKVPPEKLDEAIAKLEERFDNAVADLKTNIEAAEAAVTPYVTEEP